MNSEQAMGREVDRRSDLFRLGAVIYEMATGRRAFAGETAAAAMDQVLHSQPTAIGRLNYDVPDAPGTGLFRTKEAESQPGLVMGANSSIAPATTRR